MVMLQDEDEDNDDDDDDNDDEEEDDYDGCDDDDDDDDDNGDDDDNKGWVNYSKKWCLFLFYDIYILYYLFIFSLWIRIHIPKFLCE